MTEFFHGRRLRYEIQVLAEGRWRIEGIIDDDRDAKGRFGRLDFEELEQRAIRRAEALVASGRYREVRVMRERRRDEDFATTTEIYRKEASVDEAPLALGKWEGPIEPCAAPEDLLRRPACRVIGVVLRSFLDRHSLTPLELLHHQAHIRRLQGSYTLVTAALHHVATLQDGAAPKERVATLERLIEAVERKARDAAAERRLPVLGDDLASLAAECEARYGAERVYFVNVAMARRMQGIGGLYAKLDLVLRLLDRPLPADLASLLDEWTAGLLDSPVLVMDLLGTQKNLAGAIVALAELAQGRLAASGVAAETMGALGRALREGRLPFVVEAIWERILRELRRGRPLCRNDERQESATLNEVARRLAPACPVDLRDATLAALRERARQLRNLG